MKRFWIHSFALSIGLAASANSLAQYPAYNYHTAPSSFPVATQQHPQHSAQLNPYQFAAAQDPTVAGNPSSIGTVPAPIAQQPLPTVPDYAPVPMPAPSGSGHSAQSGMVHPGAAPHAGHYSTVAPGCASCGPAPVSQSFFQGGYGQPYSYSAPSIGWGDQGNCGPACGAGHRGIGHFGGGMLTMPEAAKPWFFGGGVLIFRRIDDYNRLLSEDDSGMPILYTEDAALGTMGGFEVMGGRYFNCGKNAIMASYWGLFPENEMVSVFDGADGIRSSIFRPWAGPDPFTGEFQLNMTGGATGDPLTDEDVYGLYDTASAHRLRRSSEFHNVEINLLGFAVGCASRNFNRATAGSLFSGTCGHRGRGLGQADCGNGECGSSDCGTCGSAPSRYATGPCCYVAPPCGSRLNLSWLAGVRYFQFNDNLEYAALVVPGLGAETLSYDVHTQNQLVGFQIGGRSDLCLGSRVNLYSMARAGIYGNNTSLTTSLGTETAYAYESNMPGMEYNISRSDTQLAFLSELGAGVGFRLSSKWTATTGYRAIIASGVATAVGNVRHQGQTIDRINVNAKDMLILHGLDIGAIYNF